MPKNIDIGKQFRNINTNELYKVEDVVQVQVSSHSDVHPVYVVRNVKTGNTSRFDRASFWKHFRFED